jgi:membrane protease YdiL (CAAX protease family)
MRLLLPPPFTPAFDRFVAPARRYNHLWRVTVGVLVIAATWLLMELFLINLFGSNLMAQGLPWLLFSFIWMILGTVLACHLLHQRPFLQLINPDGRIVWRRWEFGALLGSLGSLLTIAVGALFFAKIEISVSPMVWLLTLPFLALGLFVQTSAEELVFRGYLQQQFGARFQSAFVWWLLPSLLFAVLHWDADLYGKDIWLAMIAIGLFALCAADITARLGDLSFAMGLHFGINCIAIGVVGLPGVLGEAALFTWVLNEGDLRGLLVLDVIMITVLYWVCLRLLDRSLH